MEIPTLEAQLSLLRDCRTRMAAFTCFETVDDIDKFRDLLAKLDTVTGDMQHRADEDRSRTERQEARRRAVNRATPFMLGAALLVVASLAVHRYDNLAVYATFSALLALLGLLLLRSLSVTVAEAMLWVGAPVTLVGLLMIVPESRSFMQTHSSEISLVGLLYSICVTWFAKRSV